MNDFTKAPGTCMTDSVKLTVGLPGELDRQEDHGPNRKQ